ncbi:MAG: hypothetical protein M3O61_19825 [Gemmatimonadota bacterium]|nr:hypothetical protein [Gemmatimonadota bacterium]
MKAILKTVFAAILLATGSISMAVAGDTDPVIGTWHLNVAKSKFSPGPAPKSEVRTYTATAEGTALSWTNVGADGKETVVKSTFKADGKDYPVTGSPNFDALALKQVDSHTVKSEQKKAGKVIGTSTRSVSKDGKVLTLSGKGTGADGKSYDNVLVYDKK